MFYGAGSLNAPIVISDDEDEAAYVEFTLEQRISSPTENMDDEDFGDIPVVHPAETSYQMDLTQDSPSALPELTLEGPSTGEKRKRTTSVKSSHESAAQASVLPNRPPSPGAPPGESKNARKKRRKREKLGVGTSMVPQGVVGPAIPMTGPPPPAISTAGPPVPAQRAQPIPTNVPFLPPKPQLQLPPPPPRRSNSSPLSAVSMQSLLHNGLAPSLPPYPTMHQSIGIPRSQPIQIPKEFPSRALQSSPVTNLRPAEPRNPAVNPVPPPAAVASTSSLKKPIGMRPDTDPHGQHGVYELHQSLNYMPNPARCLVMELLPRKFRTEAFVHKWAARFCTSTHPPLLHIELDNRIGKALIEFPSAEVARVAWESARLYGEGKEHIRVYWYRLPGVGANAGVGELEEGEIEDGEIVANPSTSRKPKKERKKLKDPPKPSTQLLPLPKPPLLPVSSLPTPNTVTFANGKWRSTSLTGHIPSTSSNHLSEGVMPSISPPIVRQPGATVAHAPLPQGTNVHHNSHPQLPSISPQVASGLVEGALEGSVTATPRTRLSLGERLKSPPRAIPVSAFPLPSHQHPSPSPSEPPHLDKVVDLAAGDEQIDQPMDQSTDVPVYSMDDDTVSITSSSGRSSLPQADYVREELHKGGTGNTSTDLIRVDEPDPTPVATLAPPVEPCNRTVDAAKGSPYEENILGIHQEEREVTIRDAQVAAIAAAPSSSSDDIPGLSASSSGAPIKAGILDLAASASAKEQELRRLVLNSKKNRSSLNAQAVPVLPPTSSEQVSMPSQDGQMLKRSAAENVVQKPVEVVSRLSVKVATVDLDSMATSFITEAIQNIAPVSKTSHPATPVFASTLPQPAPMSEKERLAAKHKLLEQKIAESKEFMARYANAPTKLQKTQVMQKMKERMHVLDEEMKSLDTLPAFKPPAVVQTRWPDPPSSSMIIDISDDEDDDLIDID
ncbi:hypothetical protein BDW22DRAFT_1433513 [Trametopsis cervina]|nr:hypothetical protein BDW22DRAFT_1433513 [Trametopsis cervina]